MPEGNSENTQFICETEPLCLCLGIDTTQPYEWQAEHECDCWQGEQQNLFRICVNCGAQLVEIDDNTGEKIAA